jgi:hypothetical protein
MGTLIRFPDVSRMPRSSRLSAGRPESATVIILPVVRIERYPDEPSQADVSRSQRRRRRRRASRS